MARVKFRDMEKSAEERGDDRYIYKSFKLNIITFTLNFKYAFTDNTILLHTNAEVNLSTNRGCLNL